MKIALIGYGKMGKVIDSLAVKAGHEVVLRHSKGAQHLLQNLAASGAEVAIEFSTPDAAFDNVITCLDAQIPVVCGTTGWSAKIPQAKNYCVEKDGAFFYASNFSIGVFLFTEINRIMAHWMQHQPEYQDISISEIHHVHKKDAPSGTAISLADTLLEGLTRKNGWVAGETTNPNLLPLFSHREAEVPGTHIVQYRSSMDGITLTHEAFSREGFAAGALRAAEWIIGKKGVFDMKDMVLTPSSTLNIGK